ncbi:MAG: hypothetical protein WC728_09720 [Elusimicrobiota bacterium]
MTASWALLLLLCGLCSAAGDNGSSAATPSSTTLHEELIGSVVRSARWNIRRGGGNTVEEMTGDVTYERQGRYLRADSAVYDHKSGWLDAKGSILARQSLDRGETISLDGQQGRFNMKTKLGQLTGLDPLDPVRFAFAGATQASGTARRLRWDASAMTAVLEEDVRCSGPQGTASADQALYNHPEGSLTLQGRRPVLQAALPTWSAAVQADSIVFLKLPSLPGTHRLRTLAEGAVRGWILFPKGLKDR